MARPTPSCGVKLRGQIDCFPNSCTLFRNQRRTNGFQEHLGGNIVTCNWQLCKSVTGKYNHTYLIIIKLIY